MTENQTAQTEQKPAEATPEDKQSLEDLYAEYNVGTQPREPAIADTATQTERPPAVTSDTAIQTELAQTRAELEQYRQEKAQERDEADLTKAVDFLERESGLKGKRRSLKGSLMARASEDQRLRALWNDRQNNPRAWDKALKIIADDLEEEFAVANPQLEENQRAMDESQRAQTTSAPPPKKPEERLMSLNDRDFAHEWARIAGRVY